MSGIGIPNMMLPKYTDFPETLKNPDNDETWKRLSEEVASKYTWRMFPKMIGAYDVHCKGYLDTFKKCSNGFFYNPDSVLKCAAEFAQMRSCFTYVKATAHSKCEAVAQRVYEAHESNQINNDVADSLADCIRHEVIQQDLPAESILGFTNEFLSHVESQAKKGEGLFAAYAN